MTFQESIRVCFSKYSDFSGRATRSEYWWFGLFIVVVGTVLSLINQYASLAFYLAVMLPSVAVAARRLHDTNRSGWWQLLSLIPVVGIIVLVVFLVQESKPAAAAA